jgi:hypothetical protein
MKSMKLGVWVLVGMGLAVLLSVGFSGPEGSVSAQDSTDPVFVGAGDIARCDRTHDEATAKLLRNIVDAAPSTTTVFTTGDNAYESGTLSEYQNCYGPQPATDPNWGDFKAMTKPSPGNHEYYKSAGASGYFQYFDAAAGDPGKGYYSYDVGSWHMISLNSNCSFVAGGGCDRGSTQVEWLKKDLADHSNTCTLAYWHHPLFSSGSTSGGNSKMKPFWEALYSAEADVVLNGHVHNYERFDPQRPDGTLDTNRGIREFVVGTGGYSLNSFKTIVANSVKDSRNASAFGVLKLTLHPDSYDWEFVPVAGQTFTDSGSDSCVPDGTTPTDPVPGPPTVESTVPTGTTPVAPTINVEATFSEEMMDSSINGKTFKLFEKGSTTKLPATVSYPDPNPNSPPYTAKLVPNNPLQSGVTYKAVVTTGVKDTVGNPLAQQYRWFFTTSN